MMGGQEQKEGLDVGSIMWMEVKENTLYGDVLCSARKTERQRGREAEPGQSEQCMPEMLGDRVPRSEGTRQM